MNVQKILFKGLLILVIIGSIFFSPAKINSAQGEENLKTRDSETEIVIFHVNDIHARIDNFAKIAWLINREKEKNPNVFFMNAGDNFSGNPVVDQYIPKGKPILQLLHQLNLDVLALGIMILIMDRKFSKML